MTYPGPRRSSVVRRCAAFTLSELLVVIAVVVVLAVILNPFHTHSGAKQNQSICASHLKQISMAFGQYLTDYDGRYPAIDDQKTRITAAGPPPFPYSPVSPQPKWDTLIQPYMLVRKNDNLYRCPTDPEKRETDTSYSVNGWTEYALEQSAVRSPSAWILLGERGDPAGERKPASSFYFWTWQGTPTVWPPAALPVPTDRAARDLGLTRHGEGANWLLGDGHVRWRKFPELWKGDSENPFWPDPKP